MIFDSSCRIFDPDDYSGGVDEFGNPTDTERDTTVYDGRCRENGNRYHAVRATGNEAAQGFVYLPGSVDAEPDDLYESNDRRGRILSVERHSRYTRLVMQWL